MKRTALIGSGNAFFRDEGAGLYAAKYLKENCDFAPEVEIVDGGTLGFRLMPLLQEFDSVVIANTASDDTAAAGEVFVRGCDDFLEESRIRKTANEVEIAEMLQVCTLSGNMADVTIVSIVPEDIVSVEVGLTPAVTSAWDAYIGRIVETLAAGGVTCKKRPGGPDLDAVLAIFAEPSIEHNRGF